MHDDAHTFARPRTLVFLAALFVWLINDHVLKAAFAGTDAGLITGKLSDIAGLIAFPMALAAALRLVLGTPARAADLFAAALTAVAFALINVDQALSNAVHGALTAAAALVTGGEIILKGVADFTDLLCLPAALVPLLLPAAPSRRRSRFDVALERVGVFACIFATAATSAFFDPREPPVLPAHPAGGAEFVAGEPITFIWFHEEEHTFVEYELLIYSGPPRPNRHIGAPARTLKIRGIAVERRPDSRLGRTARVFTVSANSLKLTPGKYYWIIKGADLLINGESVEFPDPLETPKQRQYFDTGESEPARFVILDGGNQ